VVLSLPQRGEELAVTAPEVTEERLVGVQPEELPNDLDRQELAVGQPGVRTAVTQGRSVHQPVVDEAKDGDYEGAKIHEGDFLQVIGGLGQHQT
jgi:hypothetical protein